MSKTFEVPEDFTDKQVQELFELWAEYVTEALHAQHTPSAYCDTCVDVFNQHVETVRTSTKR